LQPQAATEIKFRGYGKSSEELLTLLVLKEAIMFEPERQEAQLGVAEGNFWEP
jgi:hypothetical protein